MIFSFVCQKCKITYDKKVTHFNVSRSNDQDDEIVLCKECYSELVSKIDPLFTQILKEWLQDD